MDKNQFAKLLTQEVESQALLRTLLHLIPEVMADQKDLSFQMVREQVLAMADRNLQDQLERTADIRESLGSNDESLRMNLAGNRALLETLYHFQIRILAAFQNRPIADIEQEADAFYQATIQEIS